MDNEDYGEYWDGTYTDETLPPTGLPEIDEVTDAEFAALKSMMLDGLLEIAPQTDEHLYQYILNMYGIRIPRTRVCPGHAAPFDALADLYFIRYPHQNALWVGGRGTGKTLNFAATEHLLLTHFADTIANVGAVEDQAKKCYSYIQRFDRAERFKKRVQASILSKTVYKNGGEIEILPGTMNRVNSPHPRLACLDEVDLMPWAVMQEALSMPVRTNGRPPQIVYTSSLKKRYGPMIRLMDSAQERAIRTYTFCVFEVLETCPPARHKGGEGCRSCPLAVDCLNYTVNSDGSRNYEPGPGRASKSDGFMKIDDVIKAKAGFDQDTWDSQWLCKRPSAKGLIYGTFDENIHVIDYEYQPNLPVYGGFDYGYTNASVGIYCQVLPTDEIVVFAEDYAVLRTDVEFGNSTKSLPWFANTTMREGDPAAATGRAQFNAMGISIRAAINTKDTSDDDSGISKIRWLLAPPGRNKPLIYFARGKVPNTIREIKAYHVVEKSPTADKNENEKAAKADDHCMDALRYVIARLVKFKKERGN